MLNERRSGAKADKSLLKPEMTTNVEITTTQKDDILLVPVEALTRKGRKMFVTVSKGPNLTEDRPVTIGVNDGLKAEVVEGLAEGDTVIFQQGTAGSRFNAGQTPRNPAMFPGGGGGPRGGR